jgi:hypothetical protein
MNIMGIDRSVVPEVKVPDKCRLCHVGLVLSEQTDGRFFEHAKTTGVYINIPKDFVIDRCQSCRQMFLSQEELDGLHKVMDEQLILHSDLIQTSAAAFGIAAAEMKN